MFSSSTKLLLIGAVLLPLLAGTGLTEAQQPYPPPPAMRSEAMPPPPPGPPSAWVWRPGYWRWDGVRYIWARGRYVRPPRPAAAWVPAHWAMRGGGWVWVGGHWR